MAPVISKSPEPLHRQVFRVISDQIAIGALVPGQRLPAERALAEELAVSRVTVRKALQDLNEAGLIESAVGRGSFVSGPVKGGSTAGGPLAEPPNALMGFSELGLARGFVPSARVLSLRVRPATLDESEAFRVAPGSDIFDLRRLRMLDGIPAALDQSRVPLSYAPSLVDVDFETGSMYEVLDRSGAGPVRADYTVQATRADAVQADLLGLTDGASLLVTKTSAYTAGGKLVELATTEYPSERYEFRATLIRRSPAR